MHKSMTLQTQKKTAIEGCDVLLDTEMIFPVNQLTGTETQSYQPIT